MDKFKLRQHTGVSTFASHTNQHTRLSLQKSLHLFHPDKIELKKFPFPSENKKYATTQTNTTNKKTAKPSRDDGLQMRKTEHQQPTAVWRNGGGRGKLNSSFSNQHLCLVDSLVLRNPPLRQAAKRWVQV